MSSVTMTMASTVTRVRLAACSSRRFCGPCSKIMSVCFKNLIDSIS